MKKLFWFWISFFSLGANALTPPQVSLDPARIAHLFLYRPIGTDRTEILHLDQTRCHRYSIITEDRKTETESPSSTWTRLSGEGPNPDFPGDGTESRPFGGSYGVTLFEGHWFFRKTEAYLSDVVTLSAKNHVVEFRCDAGEREWIERWSGQVDLQTYRANLLHENAKGVTSPPGWRVAHLALTGEDSFPLRRDFYLLTAKGADPELLPQNAYIRMTLSLLTNRLWFPRRKVIKKNRALALSLRNDLSEWIQKNDLGRFGLLISQKENDLDWVGEVGIYMPHWLMPAFLAKFEERIGEAPKLGKWSFEFNCANPIWQTPGQAPCSVSCVNAILNAQEDVRSQRWREENREIFWPNRRKEGE